MNPLTLDHGTFYAHELATYHRDSTRSLLGFRIRRAMRLHLLLPNRVNLISIMGAVASLQLIPTLYV